MKKLLFAVAIITMSAASVNAQEKTMTSNGTTFSIAGNIGTGTKKGFKTTYGADVQVDIPATTGLKITASAGYQHFKYKYDFGAPIGTVETDFSFIPLLAGAKFNLGPKFYGHAQLGYSISTVKGGGGDFSYAPSIGYWLSHNLDIALKYFSIGDLNAILLRLALTLGK